MMMSPRLRKLALTLHIVASVGWFGAVAAFLALAVVGLTSQNAQLVRGAYLVMSVLAWYVILPLCLASLATGILQSMGTVWGLFRHYWVLLKLIINALSTVILLLHLQPIDYISGVATGGTLSAGAYWPVRVQMVIVSGAALLALVVAITLSVYKPQGLTPYGWRKQHERRAYRQARSVG